MTSPTLESADRTEVRTLPAMLDGWLAGQIGIVRRVSRSPCQRSALPYANFCFRLRQNDASITAHWS